MSQVQSATPRKVFLGIATMPQMFRILNRHHQAPFDDRRMSGELYAGEWFRIDQASNFYMLDLLSPLFERDDHFAMREFLAGSITSVFFELRIEGDTRFYHAYCDLGDRASVDRMRAAILEHEAEAEKLTREIALEHVWSTTHDDFRGHNDGDSTKRTILVYEPTIGTVRTRLEALTPAQLADKVFVSGHRLAA